MIEVLIGDDHTIFREGLKQLLAETANVKVGGEAGSGQEVLRRLRERPYDVVLLDISLEDRSGLDVLKHIRTEWPSLPVLMLTMHPEEEYAVRALRAGAAGYLTKKSALTELVAAIQKVAHGGRYVSASLAEALVRALEPEAPLQPHESLSDREFQVFEMLVSGARPSDIARHLGVSVKTISTHRARILIKMKLPSIAALIRYAVENQLLK
jgi:two-component system, NarL family, invasion response regulator UvrY